jgi:hypothetical protein
MGETHLEKFGRLEVMPDQMGYLPYIAETTE